jgi:hypothetical protein
MNAIKWAVAFVLLAPMFSYSAEISAYRPGFISVVGLITTGDADKLINVLRMQKYGLGYIDLDSPGGDVAEAIKMAEIIKPLYPNVRVAPGRYCASACVFLWLVGTSREATAPENVQRLTKLGLKPAGTLGLHRPYLKNFDSVSNKQSEVMRQVQTYLESQMVPRRLVDLMMSRPSNDIYWLNSKDLQEFGSYRPEVEEFLINKCGYVRPTDSAMARGLTGEQMVKAMTCSENYLDEVRAKGLANLRK